MKPILRGAFLAAALFAVAFAAKAAPQPASLSELILNAAELTVVTPAGETRIYSPNDLEKLPTYRLVTRTPWRGEEASFEGILLSDLLQRHGLADAGAIRITAENDFVSVFVKETLTVGQFLIATRVDGRPLSRRSRGPFQIVVDESILSGSTLVNDGHLVWSVARIEALD